jgi:hypothetical protein
MLRERLNTACDHVTPERNIELVAEIAAEFGRDIAPLPSMHDLARYTCLVHALEFTENPGYVSVAVLQRPDVYAGKKFAEWLLAQPALVEIDATHAPVGALVMYLDDGGGFVHVGLVEGGARVQSKWGNLGLYEHDVFDVPSDYGSTVRYFARLPFEVAIRLFYRYAEENGIEFQDDAT